MSTHPLRTRTLASTLLALGLIFFSASTSVSACSCIPELDVALALDQSDAVFAGRVVGLQLTSRLSWDPSVSFATEDLVVRVAASSWWKGAPNVYATVYTAFTCCACGFSFEIGESFLIYADLVDGVLRTSTCTRTSLLSAASEDLVVLGDLQPVL